MDFSIGKFVTGPIETNTYVVFSADGCIVIDPSSGCDEVVAAIKLAKSSVKAILVTHCHFDHIMGIREIHAQWPNVPVYAHPLEKPLLANPEYNGSVLIGKKFVYDKETVDLVEGLLSVCGLSCTVLHVPGHSPGGCAFVFESSGQVHCFSGDALFAGSIGRYDFPLGDGALLITSIKAKLCTLPEDTIVYPGHGGRTTIGRENRRNPYLLENG
jgi:hydroxyacylglutathione hydrolase